VVKIRPDIRFIPFVITEFGALGGLAMVFFTVLANQEAASKGLRVGKLLASWRRKVFLAVHDAHADNGLRKKWLVVSLAWVLRTLVQYVPAFMSACNISFVDIF
jgi:hypothetical protein